MAYVGSCSLQVVATFSNGCTNLKGTESKWLPTDDLSHTQSPTENTLSDLFLSALVFILS